MSERLMPQRSFKLPPLKLHTRTTLVTSGVLVVVFAVIAIFSDLAITKLSDQQERQQAQLLATRVADTVEADLPAMRDRLLVALPGATLLADESNTSRLRRRAKLLATLEPEIATATEDAVTLPIHGFLAAAGGPDLELARELVARCRAEGHDLELMVRAPVAAGDAFDDMVAALLAVRSAGVDEVVLSADESSVDRTMALYAAMAEHLENASQSSSIPS